MSTERLVLQDAILFVDIRLCRLGIFVIRPRTHYQLHSLYVQTATDIVARVKCCTEGIEVYIHIWDTVWATLPKWSLRQYYPPDHQCSAFFTKQKKQEAGKGFHLQ